MSVKIGIADASIARQWREFSEKCIPKSAPPVQLKCMEEAFYAGACVVMGTMLSVVKEGIPPEVGTVTLEVICEELQEYALKKLLGKVL